LGRRGGVNASSPNGLMNISGIAATVREKEFLFVLLGLALPATSWKVHDREIEWSDPGGSRLTGRNRRRVWTNGHKAPNEFNPTST
jgi:hypothetical protein